MEDGNSSSYEGLEIEDHIRFDRLEARAERAGWLVMLATVVAAVLGLFGNGLIGYAENVSPDGRVAVRFDRFLRLGAPAEVVVEMKRVPPGSLDLAVDRQYLDGMNIERVTPTPASVRMDRDAAIYSFEVKRGVEAFAATFRLMPDSLGFTHGTVAAPGGRPAHLRQVIYP